MDITISDLQYAKDLMNLIDGRKQRLKFIAETMGLSVDVVVTMATEVIEGPTDEEYWANAGSIIKKAPPPLSDAFEEAANIHVIPSELDRSPELHYAQRLADEVKANEATLERFAAALGISREALEVKVEEL